MFQEFVEKALKDLSPYLMNHWEIDHVCYRTESLEHYEKTKKYFTEAGNLLIESMIGGRPIASYELNHPVSTSHGVISLVEVPAPKPGRKIESGYEHLEIVIDCTFDALIKKFPELHWDTRAVNKEFNPEIEAKFSDFNVKFHYHALNHIIELEKNKEAFNFLPKLNQFQKYNPLIAGTLPLGIGIKTSDLDVLMQASDFDKLAKDILFNFPEAKINITGEYLTANFIYGALPIEIYAEGILPIEQKAYRHLRIEGRLLKLLGQEFKKKIIALKREGVKTEPAFGKLLNLSNPYEELLELYWLNDKDILESLTSK